MNSFDEQIVHDFAITPLRTESWFFFFLSGKAKKWVYFLLFFLEIINICLSSGFIILFVP